MQNAQRHNPATAASPKGALAAANPRPALEADLAKLPIDNSQPRLLFINAHPRSGTNWLGCLMHLHRHISCTGEFTFHDIFNGVQAFVHAPGRGGRFEPMRSTALVEFQRFIRACMEGLLERKPGATWVADHTPRRLRLLVPGASYIVLFRDPRDVLVSWTYNALARQEHWVVPESAKPAFESALARFVRGEAQEAGLDLLMHEGWVRHGARQWAAHVRDDLDGIHRIESGEFPARITTVRYEDLHADTEAERARLYSFLDLDPADAEPISEATRTSTSFIKTEDPASHYRKGQVGDWKEKLSARAACWVEEEAGNELTFLGYGASGRGCWNDALRPIFTTA
jgi:hypothetical protein